MTASSSLVADFLRHRSQHLGFLRMLCRDDGLAEELFQDLAVIVLEGQERYDPHQGDLHAWIRGIARNLVRAHARQRRPVTPVDAAVEEAVARSWDDCDEAELDLRQERLARLRSCLERLGPATQDLIRRRYEDGESSQRIATASGRSIGAIDTALCRARAALLTCLGRRRTTT